MSVLFLVDRRAHEGLGIHAAKIGCRFEALKQEMAVARQFTPPG